MMLSVPAINSSVAANMTRPTPRISISLSWFSGRSAGLAGHPGLGFCQAGLEVLGAGAVDVRDGLSDGVDERHIDGVGAVCVVDGDHASRAGWQRGVHLLADSALEPVLG